MEKYATNPVKSATNPFNCRKLSKIFTKKQLTNDTGYVIIGALEEFMGGFCGAVVHLEGKL